MSALSMPQENAIAFIYANRDQWLDEKTLRQRANIAPNTLRALKKKNIIKSRIEGNSVYAFLEYKWKVDNNVDWTFVTNLIRMEVYGALNRGGESPKGCAQKIIKKLENCGYEIKKRKIIK